MYYVHVSDVGVRGCGHVSICSQLDLAEGVFSCV